MGFLAIIGAAIAGLSLWMWRAQQMKDGADRAVEMADDVRAAVRRFGYKRRTGQSVLETVDDPRLAAAGVLVSVARLDGDLSREQREAIEATCARTFQMDAGEASEVVAYARWLNQQGEAEEVGRKLSRRLNEMVDPPQRAEVLAVAAQVAAVEGGSVSDRQRSVLEGLARTMGVPPPDVQESLTS